MGGNMPEMKYDCNQMDLRRTKGREFNLTQGWSVLVVGWTWPCQDNAVNMYRYWYALATSRRRETSARVAPPPESCKIIGMLNKSLEGVYRDSKDLGLGTFHWWQRTQWHADELTGASGIPGTLAARVRELQLRHLRLRTKRNKVVPLGHIGQTLDECVWSWYAIWWAHLVWFLKDLEC